MTIKSAERITGLTITLHPDQLYCGKGEDGEFWVHARDDKDAAHRIVDLHWKDICKLVARRQDFRCLYCNGLKPLSYHHRKFRSHGRSDRPENIVGACRVCHDREHGRFEAA